MSLFLQVVLPPPLLRVILPLLLDDATEMDVEVVEMEQANDWERVANMFYFPHGRSQSDAPLIKS